MNTPASTPAPRNLTAPLAAWLRRMGFTVTEDDRNHVSGLDAHWLTAQGNRFQVGYRYSTLGPEATAHFTLGYYFQAGWSHEVLVSEANVRRLKEARLLLQSNARYALARREALASGALQPA